MPRFTAVLCAMAALFAAVFGADDARGPDAAGKYEIAAEGIRGLFIPYGASVSNLFVRDGRGVERDMVLGYDNASYYTVDAAHPHLGGVPGRYANRIKNSSFALDGVVYQVAPNENNNNDTLHGGPDGWDYVRCAPLHAEPSDLAAQLHRRRAHGQLHHLLHCRPRRQGGLPRRGHQLHHLHHDAPHVASQDAGVCHHQEDPHHADLACELVLFRLGRFSSPQTYWNLDGFQNDATPLALNHTLHLPYSGQRVGTDAILIPNGTILANQPYSVNDFWTAPKQLGANLSAPDALGNCGTNCTGYDTCFLVNRAQIGPFDWRADGPVASLWSDWSGIKVDVFSDQDAFQLYSCGGQNGAASGCPVARILLTSSGTLPLKSTQGLTDGSRPRVVEQYGCVVMEVEDWIDAINQPEWQRGARNIFGPGDDPYVLQARYEFSTV